MSNKKSVIIIAAVFVILMVGAYLGYEKLKEEVDTPQISGLEMEEETEEATIEAEGETAESEISEDASEDVDGAETELMEAMDFTVYDIEGNPFLLSDFKGKPIVLNFWASWCYPCRSEMPGFNEAYLEYQDEVCFMMVNTTDGSRETIETASSFVQESGFAFPVYYDTEIDAVTTYGAYSLPTTYFIDAQGYLVAYGKGAMDRETLQVGIDMILP